MDRHASKGFRAPGKTRVRKSCVRGCNRPRAITGADPNQSTRKFYRDNRPWTKDHGPKTIGKIQRTDWFSGCGRTRPELRKCRPLTSITLKLRFSCMSCPCPKTPYRRPQTDNKSTSRQPPTAPANVRLSRVGLPQNAREQRGNPK